MTTKYYEKSFASIRLANAFANCRLSEVVGCLHDSKTPMTVKQIQNVTHLKSVQYILDQLVICGFVEKEVREEGTRTATQSVLIDRDTKKEIPDEVIVDGYRYCLAINQEQRTPKYGTKEVTFPIRRAYYKWIG